MPAPTERFTVPKALTGQRLDKVLEALVDGYSKAQLQKLVRRGHVRLRGKRVVRSNGKVNKGDEITIEHDPVTAVPPPPEIEILYEDDELLVVVKPTGMLTHGTDRAKGDDLAAVLDVKYGPLPTSRGIERPGIVHRLDRETSGVLVVARDEATLVALQDQFRSRSVEKDYLALVSGHVTESMRIDEPIGPVPGKSDRQQVDHADGRDAVTDIDVLESFEAHTLVSCRIHTGRRHQIRVHLAAHGYPVVGDPLYGTKRQVPLPTGQSLLALHALRLAFDHPRTGERLAFEAPLSTEFDDALRSLRR